MNGPSRLVPRDILDWQVIATLPLRSEEITVMFAMDSAYITAYYEEREAQEARREEQNKRGA